MGSCFEVRIWMSLEAPRWPQLRGYEPKGSPWANLRNHSAARTANSSDSIYNIAADGSVVFRSLSQVVLLADLVLRQLADLDDIRQGMQALADELARRSELLGKCVQRAASGSMEDRETTQGLQQTLQALQQRDAHHQSRIASLSSEHERTMSLPTPRSILGSDWVDSEP